MKTIRWGIIGCGNVTEIKSGPGFQRADHSALVAVMRRNGDLAKDYAQRHGVSRWYDRAEDLIHDPEVDAVYIATPPSAHKDYSLMAAQAGKPVYVEKPMALNHSECQVMVRACEEANVSLFVAYYRRALPRFFKIKEIIESGTLGDVRAVNVTLYKPVQADEQDPQHLPWRVRPDISGGGHFVDLASHMLDFLDDVFGPIASVQGHAANQAGLYPAEDMVTGSFVFDSGIQGTGQWCATAFDRLDRTEIIGTRGKLTYATFGNDPVEVTTPHGTDMLDLENPVHIQQPLIQTMVNELNGQGTCPSTGQSAARTTWVMDQLLQQKQ
ncbi:MAG: Gfo/Idh/MocA family oxidoreductase [Planctomycetes bacterium]|nr:Gfo/Idh/MocA family oxidoreductase [Planctomycetota bacterium]